MFMNCSTIICERRILQGEEADVSGAKHDGGPEFAEVFVLVWVGAMVVTLNSQLLGGTLLVILGSNCCL